MKRWQLLGLVMLSWVLFMIYMSSSLTSPPGKTAPRVERQLRSAMDELKQLHSENLELQQKLHKDLRSVLQEKYLIHNMDTHNDIYIDGGSGWCCEKLKKKKDT